MMKKIAAGLLEAVHLMSLGVLFTMSLWIARLTEPVRAWEGSGLSTTRPASVADGFERYLLGHGPWVAAVCMVSVAVAAVLRGDAKKLLSGFRIIVSGATMLFALWAFMGLPKERLPSAWNCLFVSTGLDFLASAYLVGGGKGGGSKSPSGDAKK